MAKNRAKVLVALSGGVDSAVAAALLVEKEYDVTAAYMINYEGENKFGESCFVPDYRDAVRVAAKLGIPILKFDFTKEYKEQVLDSMFSEYENGRTPNPDILCNKYVKFGTWLKKAKELGFDYLATGHYARIGENSKINKIKLLQAKDSNKDQTYFLHQFTQDQLKYVLFPIGNFTKPEVRKLAKKYHLPVAEKEESMGICFIGEVPMREFLQSKIKTKKGKIILSDGTIIGEHEGLAFYTIGQRHLDTKLEINFKNDNSSSKDTKPLYVVDKRIETNELVVGFEDDPLLYKKQVCISNINWIGGEEPKFPLKCEVRLRHRQELQKCKIELVMYDEQKTKVLIKFEKSQRAITPGQFAVFYKKGECLGGGVIEN